MKIDARIKLHKDIPNLGSADEVVSIPVDSDYVEGEYDEIIQWIEEEIWERYGVTAYYGDGFEVVNCDDICNELLSSADEL